MVEEMLYLANQGVEIFRLDAVPFIWKRLGTNCENQPEAHTIIRAFNAMAKIAAPSVLFKSEAIVHPDEVVKYIHPDECQLSYNPLKMALLWEALATKEVKLLEHSMKHRSRIPSGCTWVNYLRCHDDIGWSFDDDDSRKVGIDPVGHRKYLNQFYTGNYPGSFARGVPFQFNPDTGDVRVSGTLSSLAGLEDAVAKADDELIEMAVRRINMLWAIQVSIGGIPLLYAGDEFGQMNDYTYLTDPTKISDSRWVHRAKRRWEARDDLSDQDTLEWRFFREMVKLFRLRKEIPAFQNGGMEVISTGNPHLFGYLRAFETQKILIINNFSDKARKVEADRLEMYGASGEIVNLLSDEVFSIDDGLMLEAYRAVWLDIS
jgi:amylosucrase